MYICCFVVFSDGDRLCGTQGVQRVTASGGPSAEEPAVPRKVRVMDIIHEYVGVPPAVALLIHFVFACYDRCGLRCTQSRTGSSGKTPVRLE